MSAAPGPQPPSPAPPRRPAVAAAVAAAMLLLAAADWYFGLTFNAALLYSGVLLVCWWDRSERSVWVLAGGAVALTVVVGLVEPTDTRALVHRCAAVVSIVASAAILHAFFKSRREVDAYEADLRRRNEALEGSNREL